MKYTLELIALDDTFIFVNRSQNSAKILTKAQYELLQPLLNASAAPRSPRYEDTVTNGMALLLTIMADYKDQISVKEMVSLTHAPKGTISGHLFRLKNLKLIYQVDRGVYQITNKGTAYAQRNQPTEHANAGTADPPR